ncbi:MAG TPA: cell division protein ZipA C-terminal FtsZ-binding domain-containing protein [Casimicrobiaceae bacterium]|nr:cell division protein ZipA C-terminal FtsZ-binding domain-containing protein [Casimicrobiaceae bacterium]
MSSLQIGLIAAGVLLVVAVIVYNLWQERRVTRRLAESRASADRARDEPPRRTVERVEPTLMPKAAPAATDEAATPVHRARAATQAPFVPPGDVIPPPAEFERAASTADDATLATVDDVEADAAPATTLEAPTAGAMSVTPAAYPQPDHEIESIIPLTPQAPVAAGALAAGLHARTGKRLRWFGRVDARSDWQVLSSEVPGRFADVIACLLLADRNGAASRAQLDTFARVVGDVAASLPATFVVPDLAQETQRAESIDRLCAELDVQIGLTVQMPEPASIPGTRLRGVAEAAGFRLTNAGRFEYASEETGAILYTLQNLRPDAFSAEMLRLTATNGVVFLLDVARLTDPVRTFDQMKAAAKRMATTLGAELVDDNRRPLDDAALGTIREQVQAAAEALRAVHIPPGSARALALFSA